MKHKSVYYYVQSQKEGELPMIVGHSVDEETGAIYHKFLNRDKANKLMKDEKKTVPQLKYRVVKLIESYEAGAWE